MTYKEIKDRLSKCELTLQNIKDGSYSNLSADKAKIQIQKLNTLKESLEKQLKEANTGDNVIITTKRGETKVATGVNDKAASQLKRDPNIDSIEKTDGTEIKEGGFDQNETAAISANVGKAVVLALNSMGENISSARVINIKPDNFTVRIVFKNDNEENYDFFIDEDDRLVLRHPSYDRDLADVGAKPSGEAVVNVDVVKDAFTKELKNIMSETMTDQEFRDAKEKDRLEKHPEKDTIKKIQALIARERRLKNTKEEVEEGEYAADKYNVNVFGYQTKYYKICPGAKSFMEKVVAGEHGEVNKEETIRLAKLHDLLFLYEIKALKDSEYAANILSQAEYVVRTIKDQVDTMGLPVDEVDYLDSHLEKISDAASETDYVKRRRDDDYSESANEGEGDDHHYIKVSKADFRKAEKIISQNIDGNNVKMDYVDDDGAGNVIIYFMFNDGDIASGEANSFMNDVVMDLEAYDIRVNDHSAEVDEAELSKAEKGKLKDMSKSLKKSSKGHAGQAKYIDKLVKEGRGDMDIIKGIIRDRANESGFEEREEAAEVIAGIAEEYMLSLKVIQAYMDSDGPVNPFDVNEDMDVGHQDDEPSMLKSTAYESAAYAAKLYKKLAKYDQFDGEVDFPNWWQSKLILAKDYLSKAFHYIDSKEKQPMIDKLALESKQVKESPEQDDAVNDLRNIVDQLEELGEEARDLVRQFFPNELSRLDGYRAFEFAYSSNRYDTTLGKFVDRLEDGDYDDLDDDDYPREGLDSDLPKGKHSIAKLQKVHGMIVDKMKELAKLYKEKGGDHEYRGHSVMDHLKSLTKKKKQVEAALDKAVAGKNKGQQLDPNVTEAAITEPIELKDALERYSFGEILDTAAEHYEEDGEKDMALLAKQTAAKFRKMLDDFDGGVNEMDEEVDADGYEIYEPGTIAPKNLYYYDKIGKIVALDDIDGLDLVYRKGDKIEDIDEQDSKLEEKYRIGDKWSENFDYEGMLTKASKLAIPRKGPNEGGLRVLQAIYDSFEDVNYHSENQHLGTAIDAYKNGDNEEGAKHLKQFKSAALETLKGLNEGEVAERAPGFKHDCAAKVVHEKYGKGNCIPEKHTLVKEGNKYIVTHYDVLFENGKTVKDIPVSELDIKTSNEHWHKGYKKKGK